MRNAGVLRYTLYIGIPRKAVSRVYYRFIICIWSAHCFPRLRFEVQILSRSLLSAATAGGFAEDQFFLEPHTWSLHTRRLCWSLSHSLIFRKNERRGQKGKATLRETPRNFINVRTLLANAATAPRTIAAPVKQPRINSSVYLNKFLRA